MRAVLILLFLFVLVFCRQKATYEARLREADVDYFASYDGAGIHKEMISDSVRTNAYRDAMLLNKDTFKDKIVLDVGCGTGILSLFAAQAGAGHVYAIDSSEIVTKARAVVEQNNMQAKISVFRGKIEEVELPQKVDIIISEWMGYAMLFESMLDSVLVARDKWLKPGGLILPNQCQLLIAGAEDQHMVKKLSFWDNVYGFNMSPMKQLLTKELLVEEVPRGDIATTPAKVLDFDIQTGVQANLSFASPFEMRATRTTNISAIVVWFDIEFKLPNYISFSTSPNDTPTHWVQATLYLSEALPVVRGQRISGTFELRPVAVNPRWCVLSVDIAAGDRRVRSQAQLGG